jgi:Ran GTPase-activating protein (RanGAP) involved in mRNA processing and transport
LAETVESVFAVLACSERGLVHLNVADTKMSNGSIFELCKLLQINGPLRSLDISENKLKEDTAKILCVAIRQNHTITSLNFRGTFRSIQPDEIATLESQLKANVSHGTGGGSFTERKL